MAPYSYFPTNYNPYMYQAQQTQQVQQPQQTSSIIWVQGEAGAKSYLVAPNTTVQLWDSEAQTIYLKSADASGMPSIKTLDYTIRDNSQPQPQVQSKFVTKNEFDELRKKVDKLIGGTNNESTVPTTKQHKQQQQ